MAFDWQGTGWLVPVRAGAKNPRVFKMPLKVEWTPHSQRLIRRLGRQTLKRSWPLKLRRRWLEVAKETIIPRARLYLRSKYHWRGATARSLKAYAYTHQHTGAHMTIGSKLQAEQPTFSPWENYVYPVGLHEGIKGHRVWVKTPFFHRRRLAEWITEHMPAAVGARMRRQRWFSIRVYRRGRRQSAHPFLKEPVLGSKHALGRGAVEALDDAIIAGIGRGAGV